jgi:polyhydroxyalkanoate synthase subunit PhaC
MTSTAEAAAAADSIGGPNPIVGIRRKDVTGSVGSLLAEVARHPRHAGAALGRLASAGAGVLRGNSTVRPDAKAGASWTRRGHRTSCTAGSCSCT